VTTIEAFGSERVARIRILPVDGGPLLHEFYYVPVSKGLRKIGEQLGEYLHAMPYREATDPWWATFQERLVTGCQLLEEATYGQLLGPPIIDRRTGRTHMPMELPPGESAVDIIKPGETFTIDIAYFDSLAEARAVNCRDDG
jgi:hypothetical protein